MDKSSNPQEIHNLDGVERNAKWIVSDVQSTLVAAYGLDVDRRIVSVAQLGGNPMASQSEASRELMALATPDLHRLRCRVVSHQMDETGCTIRVVLHYDGQDYDGTDIAPPSPVQRVMETVQATINAIHAFLRRQISTPGGGPVRADWRHSSCGNGS